ncbi:MAG: prolyl oligopeptidase family serine peptidase, partial [Endozoicomonadaceae bacterium]|nr:prolyl oligopeptidase family serine peptidase [Endozoicomonadaceae bacterium]
NFISFIHTEMIATSKQAECVAWIEYQKGSRSLWVAFSPYFEPIAIESTEDTAGLSIIQVDLSDSAHYLLYMLEEKKQDGSICNQLYLFDLRTMKVLQIFSDVHQWMMNESQSTLLYVAKSKDNILMEYDFKSSHKRCIWELSGQIINLSLYALEQKIAICYNQNGHHLLSIIYLKTNQMIWVSDNLDDAIDPIWSPNGKNLAFLVKDYDLIEGWMPISNCDLPAYSIMLFQETSQQLEVLWNSHSLPIASYSSQEGHRPISWLNNQQLIFCHEGSQWEHAHSLNINDKQCIALTSGDFLVRDLSVCQKTERIFLINNRHHLSHYGIDIIQSGQLDTTDTLALQTVLSERLAFSIQVISKTGRYIAFLSASETMPIELTIYDLEEQQLIYPRRLLADFISFNYNDFSPIQMTNQTFKAIDHVTSEAQVMQPARISQHAAIIHLHDGPGKQNLPGFQPSLEMSLHYALCRYLTHMGFIVVNLNYRGSSGYMRDFREAPYRAWHGASEYNDVLASAKWLLTQKTLCHKKIGLMGKGWGGYLTALGLAKDSHLFHAGIDIQGFHHFPQLFRHSSRFMRSTHYNLSALFQAESVSRDMACSQLAIENSPWNYLQSWMSPVLLIYSEYNEPIFLEEGKRLRYMLKKQGVKVDSYLFTDEYILFQYHDSWRIFYNLICDFFNQKLNCHDT